MTTRSAVIVLLIGLAGVAGGYVWFTPHTSPGRPEPAPATAPIDPGLFDQFRDAYRASLDGPSAPGLREMLGEAPSSVTAFGWHGPGATSWSEP